MEGRIIMTEGDILEALRDALTAPTEDTEGAYTAAELSESMDLHVRRVHALLKAALRRGEAECVRVMRHGIDGRRAMVPAYRMVGTSAQL